MCKWPGYSWCQRRCEKTMTVAQGFLVPRRTVNEAPCSFNLFPPELRLTIIQRNACIWRLFARDAMLRSAARQRAHAMKCWLSGVLSVYNSLAPVIDCAPHKYIRDAATSITNRIKANSGWDLNSNNCTCILSQTGFRSAVNSISAKWGLVLPNDMLVNDSFATSFATGKKSAGRIHWMKKSARSVEKSTNVPLKIIFLAAISIVGKKKAILTNSLMHSGTSQQRVSSDGLNGVSGVVRAETALHRKQRRIVALHNQRNSIKEEWFGLTLTIRL